MSETVRYASRTHPGRRDGKSRVFVLVIADMTPDACRHRLAEVAEPPGCEIPKEGRIDLDLQALTRQAGRRSPATVMFADTRVVVAGTGSTAVSNLGRYLTNPDWGPYTANTRGSHFFTDPLFLTLEHRNTEGVEDRPSPVLTFTADYDDSGQLTEISGLAEYESDGRELAPRLRTFPLDADDTDRIVLRRHPDSTDSQETTMARHDLWTSARPLGPDDIFDALGMHTNVLLEGVAGSGKSHHLRALRDRYREQDQGVGRVEFVVFHPSTTYEDFVRGLRPNPQGQFEIQDGLFVEMCKEAWEKNNVDHLLFIDEINRANTARVLGDLLYAIEPSKRVDPRAVGDSGSALTDGPCDGAVRLLVGDEAHPQYLRVPRNLHILGTMNSTDRSVGTLDLALQRRFFPLTQTPLSGEALVEQIHEDIDHFDTSEVRSLVEYYTHLNDLLREEIGVDAIVGHSHFFCRGIDDFTEYAKIVQGRILRQVVEVFCTFGTPRETIVSIFDRLGDLYAGGPAGLTIEVVGNGLGERPLIESFASADHPTDESDHHTPSDDKGSADSENASATV